MRGFLAALAFLTVLPGKTSRRAGRGEGAWFPVVGLILGFLLALSFGGFRVLFPAEIAACLTVGAWALLTGGLHLDGLADSSDALGAPASRARRLEILEDPRLGAFGAAALALFLLLKVLAVASLPSTGSPMDTLPLLVAPVLARGLVLWAGRKAPVRGGEERGGEGARFAGSLTTGALVRGSALPVIVVVLAGRVAVVAAALSVACVLAIRHVARRRLGAVTGDVLGLVVEAVELVALLTWVAAGKT